MDMYEGPARLEWRANRSTCLCSVNVRVLVVSDDSGWHVSAALTQPLIGEGWEFLLALSPYFTLRFEDDEEALIDVHVNESSEGELALTAA